MNTETLDRAIRLRQEIATTERAIQITEKGKTVEIYFNLGGYGCNSIECEFLSSEELSDIKNNINELIRKRAQVRLEDLQKEFDNL